MTQKELLQKLINCMTFASGAAGQLIHAHQDPQFIPVRDILEEMKNNIMAISMGPADPIAERLRKRGIILQ